jgi:hypothetical protein
VPARRVTANLNHDQSVDSEVMKTFDHDKVSADPLWSHRGQPVEHLERRITYQSALRAVGAYLDEHGARRINLLESGDGFAVRYQPQRDTPDSVLVLLSTDKLLDLSAQPERKRRRGPFGLSTSIEHGAYENVLRALGFELDQVHAYSILVDEIDEGMVVTYQYLKPAEGFNARKRMVILGAAAMQSVLNDAKSRREQRERGDLALLAG